MGDKDRIFKALEKAGIKTGSGRSEQSVSERYEGRPDEIFDGLPFFANKNRGGDLRPLAVKMVESVGGKVVFGMTAKDVEDRLPEASSLTIQGEFLVAENGAVWVEPAEGTRPADIFLAENLIIEVSANNIVQDMHEAYAQLNGRDFSYGTFISGPSKTADIEQCLVIGAQGPKTCTIVLLEDS